MKFEFFSMKDQQGNTIVDCFKAENTTYCDSPRTPRLDVVKIENTTADRNSRDTFYYVESRRVRKEVWGFANPEFERLVRFYPDIHHHMEVNIRPKVVQGSERFFRKTLKFSAGILALLKEVVQQNPEWENKESFQDRDVYRAAVKIVVRDGVKIEVSDTIRIEITVPKSQKSDQKDYPLRFIIGENEYLYQLQTLPPEIQREIEKLKGGKIFST